MTIVTNTAAAVTPEKTNSNLRRRKLGFLLTDPAIHNHDSDYDDHSSSRHRFSDASTTTTTSADNPVVYYSNPNSAISSPYNPMSPWSQPSPYAKSPWIHQLVASSLPDGDDGDTAANSYGLIGSLYREEGHVYSLAAASGLLYTGSDSKNVRVWKNLQEFSGFKSSSGFVKAIVVYANRIFTGHQDGKIRVWKLMGDQRNTHKRVGSLPTTRDLLMKSMNPKNYVEVRRHRNVPWVKHYDAVSCLSVDADRGLLYSGSWDKTLKVWRISDSKCLESVAAHDDAVNSVAVGFDGLVFTGSADGTVKAWRRELVGRSTRHVLVDTMLRGDHALTSLAVGGDGGGALYAGSSDGLVSFWERGKHFMSYGGVLRGHKLAVLCLAVGGSLVMSGSADKTICVWRRDGGGLHSCLAVLTGHSGPVKCLAVERDSSDSSAAVADEDTDEDKRWIAYSGCLDNSVKVWRVSEHAGLNAEDDDEEEEE